MIHWASLSLDFPEHLSVHAEDEVVNGLLVHFVPHCHNCFLQVLNGMILSIVGIDSTAYDSPNILLWIEVG